MLRSSSKPKKIAWGWCYYPRVAEVLVLWVLYVTYVLIVFERLTRGLSE